MCDSMGMPLLFSPTGVGVLEGVGVGGMKEPELHERGGKEFPIAFRAWLQRQCRLHSGSLVENWRDWVQVYFQNGGLEAWIKKIL